MTAVAQLTDGSRVTGWPVDAHVHLHRLSDVAPTLDAAARNFRRLAPTGHPLAGGLLLTQMSRERVFEALAEMDEAGDWRLERVPDEPETLIATKDGHSLAMICGRQVRADDGLEVAALGTLQSFADGRPFAATLAEVVGSGAITAVPWGFGKWLGTRGRSVEAELARQGDGRVFLGDSGSRAWPFAEPTLIRRARARGVPVIAGTDPFPFAGDCRRVGSFGFLAQVEPDEAGPLRSLRNWLAGLRSSPALYGRPSGPFRFLLNQVGVQVHNRLRKDKSS
jgi:hypothetical protein